MTSRVRNLPGSGSEADTLVVPITVSVRAPHDVRQPRANCAARVCTEEVLRGLAYGTDGCLEDDTGHRWTRVSDWVEPAEAERLVYEGTRLAVQRCREPPVVRRRERFRRDVRAHMLTSSDALAYADEASVPTVMVGELWSSRVEGRLLLFVEQAPFRRSPRELQNDW